MQLLQEKAQAIITKAELYFSQNYLKLNAKKTQLMCFNHCPPGQELTVTSYNEVISASISVKYLGFYLDPKLSFQEHCEFVCKKLNICCIIIQRYRWYLPKDALKLIFNSIGQAYIIYFSIFLANNCYLRAYNQLQKKYDQCGMTIHNCTHHNLLQHKWYPLNTLLQNRQILFLHNIITQEHPLSRFLIPTQHTYTLRKKSTFTLPSCKKNSGKKSMSFWAPKLWNNLPEFLKTSTGKELHKFLKNTDT